MLAKVVMACDGACIRPTLRVDVILLHPTLQAASSAEDHVPNQMMRILKQVVESQRGESHFAPRGDVVRGAKEVLAEARSNSHYVGARDLFVNLGYTHQAPVPSLDHLRCLAAILSDQRPGTLSRLSLSHAKLRDQPAAAILGAALRSNRVIERLDLSHNELETAEALGTALGESGLLSVLRLAHNRLGARFASSMAEAMGRAGQSVLQCVSWDNNPLGDAGGSAVAQMLRTRPCSLTLLSLASCGIGDAGASSLGEALRELTCPLLELQLAQNGVGDAGMAALGDALELNGTLLTLDVSGQSTAAKTVLDAGTAGLFRGVTGNRTLTTLLYENNLFGLRGAVALGLALQVNTSLTTLKIVASGRVDVACEQAVWDGLRVNAVVGMTPHVSTYSGMLIPLPSAEERLSSRAAWLSSLWSAERSLLALSTVSGAAATTLMDPGSTSVNDTLRGDPLARTALLVSQAMESHGETMLSWVRSNLRACLADHTGVMAKNPTNPLVSWQVSACFHACVFVLGVESGGVYWFLHVFRLYVSFLF